MNLLKKFWVQLLIILIISGLVGWYVHSQEVELENSINSFEDCAAAGYPIMESYPEQCRTPGGKHFVRIIEEEVLMEGEIVCLPHKNTNGPQTLECAFGLKAENGNYYGLTYPPNALYPPPNITGEKVAVHGVLKQAPDTRYDIVANIEVGSIE